MKFTVKKMLHKMPNEKGKIIQGWAFIDEYERTILQTFSDTYPKHVENILT